MTASVYCNKGAHYPAPILPLDVFVRQLSSGPD